MLKISFLVTLLLGFSCGCTMVVGHGVFYLSVLQKKSLAITPTQQGVSVSYTTDSDPAVQAFREGFAAAAAMQPAAPEAGAIVP